MSTVLFACFRLIRLLCACVLLLLFPLFRPVCPLLPSSQSYDEYGTLDEYGSYPASSFEEDAASILNDTTSSRPRILLMGSRRSGKSSIQKVVFHKMSPHETLFLESTNDIRVRDVQTSALLHFHLLDFPGGYEFSGRMASGTGVTADKIFHKRLQGTLVFVIDAQDDENQFSESIDYFLSLARTAYTTNPHLHYAILIHKVDGDSYVSEEHKSDCHVEIKKTVTEELSEAALPIHPQFYMTSIYDHSIFEAMSKIVQQLIPQLSVLETLLDGLIVSCAMDKAFLFDIVSKIYIATDSNPVDMQTYELCSDMIDVVIDVSCIYGIERTASGVQRIESAAGGAAGGGLGYDEGSGSEIHLSNEYTLYLRQVNRYLALVCLMREDNWKRGGLIEYNFGQMKEAIARVLEVREGSGVASASTNGGGKGPVGGKLLRRAVSDGAV